jgi:S-adenosylmethionine:tRNA ribosyltransferase-isomerase
MISLSAFDYRLPPELIAQQPAEPRDSSRLMVVKRTSGALENHIFHELPQLLGPNDVLVRNNTKVLPARVIGQKQTGGHVELLLAKRLSVKGSENAEIWECLTKPGLKPGQVLEFPESKLQAECEKINDLTRHIRFNLVGDELLSELHRIGQTPLPPYIEWQAEDEERVRELYQTTFAKYIGSAAAPTAGLHFTPEVDRRLAERGVQIEEVTLHVGLGTFLPVKTDDVAAHHMHSEWFELKPDVADRLNQAKRAGKRIIAVGTTTCRVLETAARDNQSCGLPLGVLPQQAETDIYIYPPFQFRFVDAMITNFHLPKSSLLMLITALVSMPNTYHQFSNFAESVVGQAYQKAIAEGYRFYSFGDAMLIE